MGEQPKTILPTGYNIPVMRSDAIPPVEITCLHCGSKFLVPRRRSSTAKYCSQPCNGMARKKNHLPTGFTLKKGYVRVYDPLHHRADTKGYVREHILVMESIIQWPVELPASIHHKDGNSTNNQPDNLELFTSHSEHSSYHSPKGRPVAARWT